MLKFASSASAAATAEAGAETGQQCIGPKRVFIGGGGELATAREVLKYKSVEKVIMVDLDEDIVNISKQYLPEWGGLGVINDPRFELVIGDAHQYIFDYDDSSNNEDMLLFDVIIMDISDPIEAGPGVMLYTTEFYRRCASQCLSKPYGVLVTQSGLAESVPTVIGGGSSGSAAAAAHSDSADDVVIDPMCFAPIYNTLQTAFDCVVPYSMNIPSFGSDWGFNMAFQCSIERSNGDSRSENNGNGSKSTNSPIAVEIADWKLPSKRGRQGGAGSSDNNIIDELIVMQITGAGGSSSSSSPSLKYYDGETHVRMFHLPKPLRTYMQNDDRIITRDNPIYMY